MTTLLTAPESTWTVSLSIFRNSGICLAQCDIFYLWHQLMILHKRAKISAELVPTFVDVGY